jgi:hypothetical protein
VQGVLVGEFGLAIAIERRFLSEQTHLSKGQFCLASTCIRSGRVLANSLYTVQDEAKILWPPLAAQSRVSIPMISQEESVWNGFVI